jgi:hypothetical protein
MDRAVFGVMTRAVVWLLVAAVAAGCGATARPEDDPGVTLEPRPLPTATATARVEPTAGLPPRDAVNVLGRRAVVALRDQEMGVVAGMVHPEKGLLFSPEAYVDGGDLVFGREAVAGLMGDQTLYTWGQEAGSGFAINMPFFEYYHEYVYDQDYAAAPQVAVGERLAGQGGTIDNTGEFWPGSIYVEHHFPGSEQYGGLDWKSLRLVFEEIEGEWWLVGVVHDAWSP